jgi:hypothetical protein
MFGVLNDSKTTLEMVYGEFIVGMGDNATQWSDNGLQVRGRITSCKAPSNY